MTFLHDDEMLFKHLADCIRTIFEFLISRNSRVQGHDRIQERIPLRADGEEACTRFHNPFGFEHRGFQLPNKLPDTYSNYCIERLTFELCCFQRLPGEFDFCVRCIAKSSHCFHFVMNVDR